MSNYSDVGSFHKKFGLRHDDFGNYDTSDELLDFRVKFMQEELDEFVQSRANHDLAGMFDALIDLVYVAMGTSHMMGFPWQVGWDKVHTANMQKQRAMNPGDSKRGSAFDVVKPAGWTPPDLDTTLRMAQLYRESQNARD